MRPGMTSKGEEISIDRDIDRSLALVFLVLVALSLYNAINAADTLVRLELIASMPLNVLASVSFYTREAAQEGTHRREIMVPALSFMLPFTVMNVIVIHPADYSSWLGLLVAIPGVILACSSLVVLRRSFSILPAVRKITKSGPYHFVRHPLYLGETIYLCGMMLLAFNILSVVLLILSIIFLVLRIGIEERKLSSYEEYREYMDEVRFRLIPGVY
jgi:protein-S-isoprenylcysteine O-methyltransferase Ste14